MVIEVDENVDDNNLNGPDESKVKLQFGWEDLFLQGGE